MSGLLASSRCSRNERPAECAWQGILAAVFSRDREELYGQLELWKSYLRDLLMMSEGCDDLVANSDRLVQMRSLARLLRSAGIVSAITALRECRQQLEDNANARLALEVLLLRLPRTALYEEAGSDEKPPFPAAGGPRDAWKTLLESAFKKRAKFTTSRPLDTTISRSVSTSSSRQAVDKSSLESSLPLVKFLTLSSRNRSSP